MGKSPISRAWKRVFHSGDPLMFIIGVNTLIFLLLNVLNVFIALRILPSNVLTSLLWVLQLPADISNFLLRPWTLITYMFTQQGLFHFLFNMLWLYWMGRIFLDYLSKRQFLFTYIAGGVAGGLLYLLIYQLIPVFAENKEWVVLIGSSASVSAIVFATATLVPNYTIRMLFFGNVPLKYLALAFLVLDFIGIGGTNAGGNAAHLGGALIGYLYIKALQNGNDWSTLLAKLQSLWAGRPKKRKLKVVSRNKSTYQGTQRQKNTTSTSSDNQARIDAILDKISKSGYENLTRDEKDVLFRASTNPREKGRD